MTIWQMFKQVFKDADPPREVDDFDYGAAMKREMEHQVMMQREHGIMMEDRPHWIENGKDLDD